MMHIAQLDYTVKALQKLFANTLAGKRFLAANDPYTHGPLTGYSARLNFWHDLIGQDIRGKTENHADDRYCAPFLQEVVETLRHDASTAIYFWDGGTGDEAVLLRMLCHVIDGMTATIRVVKVAPYNGLRALVNHPPELLADALESAQLLSQREIAELARHFMQLQNSGALLRGITAQGALVDLPLSAYDDHLLAGCEVEWKSALRVVGEALARGDARNPVGDTFYISRLAVLLAARRIEGDGPLTAVRQLRVRLPH